MTSRISIITTIGLFFSQVSGSILRKWTEHRAAVVEDEIMSEDHEWLPQETTSELLVALNMQTGRHVYIKS